MKAVDIIREVASLHGVTVAQITGRSKLPGAVAARFDIAARLRTERGLTYGQIALLIGRRRQNMRYYLNPGFRDREIERVRRRRQAPEAGSLHA